jgi:hypothetical protein
MSNQAVPAGSILEELHELRDVANRNALNVEVAATICRAVIEFDGRLASGSMTSEEAAATFAPVARVARFLIAKVEGGGA